MIEALETLARSEVYVPWGTRGSPRDVLAMAAMSLSDDGAKISKTFIHLGCTSTDVGSFTRCTSIMNDITLLSYGMLAGK